MSAALNDKTAGEEYKRSVLMVSTSYPSSEGDWRGVFIQQIAQAQSKRSDLSLSLWAPPGPSSPGITACATIEEKEHLANLARLGGIAHLLRTKLVTGLLQSVWLLRTLSKVYKRVSPDLYHVNWLQNALTLPKDRRPTVIAVLGTDMQLLQLPLMKSAVRRVLKNRAAAICPNADWMAESLYQSFGDLAEIRPVPFGIDDRWYEVIRPLRFPKPTQWIVVSRLTRGKIGSLFQWCEHLFSGAERTLHLFGPMQETIDLPPWVVYHGPAAPEELAQLWFATAVGLITLSQHPEGRPQVLLEAMAAGLPIVASRLPAHEDLITHQETGYLVGSEADFSNAISTLEEPSTNSRIGSNSRHHVRDAFGTWAECVQRYVDIYDQLMGPPDK